MTTSPIKPRSTKRSPRPSASPPPPAPSFGAWPRITADQLTVVREPIRWTTTLGGLAAPESPATIIRRALLGPIDNGWTPPAWLLPHQRTAARRIAESLRLFGGGLLCDAVGLGKTYVALAVASRYETASVVAPATVLDQWAACSARVGVPIGRISHEALSRGRRVPPCRLIVVDEAHRFRNPDTRRYDGLARSVGGSHVLLVTATPVVNTPRDLAHLLRLFLPDHGLAIVGMPSIDAVGPSGREGRLPDAIAPLIVSRSASTAGLLPGALPATADGNPVAAPTLPSSDLRTALVSFDGLRFPTFDSPEHRQLLRMHLEYRLASSVPACIETLARHENYLRRAIDAADRGERLGRSASRALFGADPDPQLTFDALWTTPRRPLSSRRRLHAELRRVRRILERLRRRRAGNPKLDRLETLLAARRGAKTLVFTTAVATAAEIATRMAWRSLAVVTGRGARVASGRISVAEALRLFAPRATGAPPEPSCAPVEVLVATDLVSEGLNLQDADAVVHYDLPWTPLRLQQRTGRIARLGSPHQRVSVWWFRPAPELERRLRLRHRIDRKADHQRRAGVPLTTLVGRTRVAGIGLAEREALAREVERSGDGTPTPCHAVVRGPAAAAFAIRWDYPDGTVPEVVAFRGSSPTLVPGLAETCGVVTALVGSPPSAGEASPEFLEALGRLLKDRLRGGRAGPRNDETRRLGRAVVRCAAAQHAARNVEGVDVLDAVLARVTDGLVAGGARELAFLSAGAPNLQALRDWLHRWPSRNRPLPVPTVEAALIGDGTD